MEEKFNDLVSSWKLKDSNAETTAAMIFKALSSTKFEWDIYDNKFIIKYPNLTLRQIEKGKINKTFPMGDGWLLIGIYERGLTYGVTRDSLHTASNYRFSHVNGLGNGLVAWRDHQSFCFGSSFFHNVAGNWKKDENSFKLFLFNLREFLEVESIDGGPYHRFENNMGEAVREMAIEERRGAVSTFSTDISKIQVAIEKGLIKATVSYLFGNPFTKITIMDEEKLASFIGLKERTIYGKRGDYIEYRTGTIGRVKNTLLFMFKGEEVRLKKLGEVIQNGRLFLTPAEKNFIRLGIQQLSLLENQPLFLHAIHEKPYKEKIETKNGVPIKRTVEQVGRYWYNQRPVEIQYIFDEISRDSDIAAKCKSQISPEIFEQITVFV